MKTKFESLLRVKLQTAHFSSASHTPWRLHTVPFNAERRAGKLRKPIFIAFGLTPPGIEPVYRFSSRQSIYSSTGRFGPHKKTILQYHLVIPKVSF